MDPHGTVASSELGRPQPRGLVAATIVASVTAGAVAARAFRAWRERQEAASLPAGGPGPARQFLADEVLPHVRPALLDLLEGLHAASDEVFERAEQFLRDF